MRGLFLFLFWLKSLTAFADSFVPVPFDWELGKLNPGCRIVMKHGIELDYGSEASTVGRARIPHGQTLTYPKQLIHLDIYFDLINTNSERVGLAQGESLTIRKIRRVVQKQTIAPELESQFIPREVVRCDQVIEGVKTCSVYEAEVETEKGKKLLLQAFGNQDHPNFVTGVVVTFLSVTKIKFSKFHEGLAYRFECPGT